MRLLTIATLPLIPFACASASSQQPLNGASADGTEYSYILVGSGAAGSVLSDRLSSRGESTLLLEAGERSSYASGGREGPSWLAGHALTRFDVPGFFGAFSHQCGDIPVRAACVLGGGTAVNSGLWFLPAERDWEGFGAQWRERVPAAVGRVRDRIPGRAETTWFQEAWNVLGRLARAAGYKRAREAQAAQNGTYARVPFMSIGGERGGPLQAYYLRAAGRGNLKVEFGAKAQRVLRDGGTATGVEYVLDGKPRVAMLKPGGKVVLSAGAFGSPKVLWQSGIGTRDQLEIVRAAKGNDGMVDEKDWIDLPVGYNLMDHPATYTVFRYPGVGEAYNYSGAYSNPNPHDAQEYLEHRTGPLASSNARITLWQSITGGDGVNRTLQWTGRTSSFRNFTGPDLLLMTSYLTSGQTSRGRVGLTAELNLTILESPYLATAEDAAAVVQSFSDILAGVQAVPGLELLFPDLKSTTIEEHVRGGTDRGANHWLGTAAVGKVVDVDAKVFGMQNLYVVDASIFPGMVASNPVGAIVVMAEVAAEGIMAGGDYGGGPVTQGDDTDKPNPPRFPQSLRI